MLCEKKNDDVIRKVPDISEKLSHTLLIDWPEYVLTYPIMPLYSPPLTTMPLGTSHDEIPCRKTDDMAVTSWQFGIPRPCVSFPLAGVLATAWLVRVWKRESLDERFNFSSL